eukprot:665276-Pleurochrysis_carterae.AAC.1
MKTRTSRQLFQHRAVQPTHAPVSYRNLTKYRRRHALLRPRPRPRHLPLRDGGDAVRSDSAA